MSARRGDQLLFRPGALGGIRRLSDTDAVFADSAAALAVLCDGHASAAAAEIALTAIGADRDRINALAASVYTGVGVFSVLKALAAAAVRRLNDVRAAVDDADVTGLTLIALANSQAYIVNIGSTIMIHEREGIVQRIVPKSSWDAVPWLLSDQPLRATSDGVDYTNCFQLPLREGDHLIAVSDLFAETAKLPTQASDVTPRQSQQDLSVTYATIASYAAQASDEDSLVQITGSCAAVLWQPLNAQPEQPPRVAPSFGALTIVQATSWNLYQLDAHRESRHLWGRGLRWLSAGVAVLLALSLATQIGAQQQWEDAGATKVAYTTSAALAPKANSTPTLPTQTPIRLSEPSRTRAPTSTTSPTPLPTRTARPSPTATGVFTPTDAPPPTPTSTPIPVETATPTRLYRATATFTASPTPTP